MGTNEWPTPVIYLGGAGRSGSTLLADILGEVPGFVAVGDLRRLWKWGIVENRLCGCGVHVSECAFWTDVLDITLGPTGPGERVALAGRLHAELEARTRLRTLPHHLRTAEPPLAREVDELEDVLGRLYAAVTAVAGADVVVDSSTLPTYAAVLDGLDEIDVRVAHFVRDPRAAAYSWGRRTARVRPGAPARREWHGGRSALLWAIWNRSLEVMMGDHPQGYARLTYEEFLADPRAVVERLLEELDLVGDLGPVFAGPTTVRLRTHHTVGGDPAAHARGLVPLLPDLEWQERMPATDRGTVAALVWPTLRRYGYRLRA